LPTVIRLGSVDSTHVQTTPVHNGNVFANYVNSTKFDELSHLKMNPNSTTWHSGRIDHFSNIFLLSSNLELNLSSVKVNSLSRFKRCGNLANCYTLVTYFTGVGTMGTGGYIVPPSSGHVPPVPPSQRCGLCQNFKQKTLTTRLYKVRTNLYPPLTKTFRRA